jgi:hypothetical protein
MQNSSYGFMRAAAAGGDVRLARGLYFHLFSQSLRALIVVQFITLLGIINGLVR